MKKLTVSISFIVSKFKQLEAINIPISVGLID